MSREPAIDIREGPLWSRPTWEPLYILARNGIIVLILISKWRQQNTSNTAVHNHTDRIQPSKLNIYSLQTRTIKETAVPLIPIASTFVRPPSYSAGRLVLYPWYLLLQPILEQHPNHGTIVAHPNPAYSTAFDGSRAIASATGRYSKSATGAECQYNYKMSA